MKFFTTIGVTDREKAKEMFCAFFKKCNIHMKGDGIEAELSFDEIPDEIISLIGKYIDEGKVDFKFGNGSSEPHEESCVNNEDAPKEDNNTELEDNQEIGNNEKEDDTVKDEEPKVDETERSDIRLKAVDEVPEIAKILEGSNSFDEDVMRIANWIGLERPRGSAIETLKIIFNTVRTTKKTSWNAVKKELRDKGISTDIYMRRISIKLKNCGYEKTTFQFLIEITRGEKAQGKNRIIEIETGGIRLKPILQNQEISEILKKSVSLDEDIKGISEWLGVNSKHKYLFENFIRAAIITPKINISAIIGTIYSKGILYGSYERHRGRGYIEDLLNKKGIYVGVSKFIELLIKGEEVSLREQKESSHQLEEAQLPEAGKALSDTEDENITTIQTMFQIECVVDMNTTIEERLHTVLKAMKLDEFNHYRMSGKIDPQYDENGIFTSCNYAIIHNLENADIDQLCSNIDRMMISTFINWLLRENKINEQITVLDFFVILQRTIVSEDEIIK